MRDHLAHRYFDTAHSIVQATVEVDLPPLVAAVQHCAVSVIGMVSAAAVGHQHPLEAVDDPQHRVAVARPATGSVEQVDEGGAPGGRGRPTPRDAGTQQGARRLPVTRSDSAMNLA